MDVIYKNQQKAKAMHILAIVFAVMNFCWGMIAIAYNLFFFTGHGMIRSFLL